MKLVPRRVVEDFSRDQYRKHFEAQKQQEVVGAMETLRMIDKREMIFRQRMYRVPPVPFDLAARLLDVQQQMLAMKKRKDAPVSEVIALYAEVARLSKLACRPAGRLRRLFWRFLPNPFRKATPYEVGRNISFFSMSLALDQEPQAWGPVRSALGTSSPMWQGSLTSSLRGRIAEVSRSRGRTS